MPTPRNDAIELLSALIRSACVNDGTPDSGQEVRNARILDAYLEGSGVEVERVEPHPGRVSAIFRVRGSDPNAPALTLLGHTDVVPADPSAWSRDPFSGEIADGIVWGRGAVDMLNLTSAMAVVTKRIAERENPLAGDLVFAAVADEEAGSRFGTGWIAEHRPDLLPWDHAITESGGAHITGPGSGGVTVTVGEKGGARRQVVARGRSGHGSMPWGSRNAAALIAEATLRLAAHRGTPAPGTWWPAFVAAHGFDAETNARLLDPATLTDAIGAFGDAAQYAHAVTHLTIAPTVLAAGTKINVIPATGTLDLDIRLLAGQRGADADAEIAAALGDFGDAVEVLGDGELGASESSTTGPLYRSIERALTTEFPNSQVVPVHTGGGTDARTVRRRGGEAYGFAAFEPDWTIGRYRALFHGDDEHIDIASLLRTTRTLEAVVTDFLGGQADTPEEDA